MEKSLYALYLTARLNTTLFDNSLENIPESLARKRPNPRTNSIIYIAAHVLDARYYLANHCELKVTNPFQEILDRITDISHSQELPPLHDIIDSWRVISDKLLPHLKSMNNSQVEKKSAQAFLVADKTILGAIAFLLSHESYHIGQLSFIRKFLGFPPMRYE